MVSPSKTPWLSLPDLVSRKTLGNGHGGVWFSSRSTARGDNINIPWAASPPSAFCQEKVTTSSLGQSSGCAKQAEVASQIVRPLRLAAIQSALGTRTPDVVPFHVNTTSLAGSTLMRSGISPYGALSTVTSLGLSSLTTSVSQPSPKDSQASTVTSRAPRSDQSAISKAPVSDAGTIPMRYAAGTSSSSRVRSIARLSLALPNFDRCERPTAACASAERLQPGRLAQGPEEKCGTLGRLAGFALVIMQPSRKPNSADEPGS